MKYVKLCALFYVLACSGQVLAMNTQPVGAVQELFESLKEKLGTRPKTAKDNNRLISDAPVLALMNGHIRYNDEGLPLRSNISNWTRVLGSDVQCSKTRGVPMLCKWDRLGIEVGSDGVGSKSVDFVNVYLKSELADYTRPATPKGKPPPPIPEFIVRGSFPYVLLFGDARVTSTTTFSELREKSDPSMRLRCDVDDCQFPHGSFGEKATVSFSLNGRTARNTINMVTISAVD